MKSDVSEIYNFIFVSPFLLCLKKVQPAAHHTKCIQAAVIFFSSALYIFHASLPSGDIGLS
jgi:hypothetical protein